MANINSFKPNTVIDSLSVYITTLCNYHCLGCCAGTQVKNSITVEEMRELRMSAGSLRELIITGGEPTLHKHFPDIMEEVFKMDYKRLVLATNGYGLMKYIDLMDRFDDIRISHYDKKSYPEAQENIHIIEQFKRTYTGKALVRATHITMIQPRGKVGVCGRAFIGIASYFDKKIYGCCVAAGIDTATGIKFDKDWRESTKEVELPCGSCPFAT